MSEQFKNHDSVEATATTSDATSPFQVQVIEYIRNDGSVNLVVNFDRATSARGAVTIKPSEVWGPCARQTKTLYYKSSSSTCAFRAFGLA